MKPARVPDLAKSIFLADSVSELMDFNNSILFRYLHLIRLSKIAAASSLAVSMANPMVEISRMFWKIAPKV